MKFGKSYISNQYRLGFGGIPIMSGRDSEFLVQLKDIQYTDALETIDYAICNDITFFDTARSYGDSEEKIGKVISGYNRDSIFIASKSKALSYKDMEIDVMLSLKAMKVDYIDLYQFHYVKDEMSLHQIMSDSGAYKKLLELKQEGIIKNIGVASHSSSVIKQAIDTMEIDSIQIPYNIIENENEEIIKYAKSKGLFVIVMKPYAGGSLVAVDQRFDGVISSDRILKEMAVGFILDQQVDMVIPGMSSQKEVEENISIFRMFHQGETIVNRDLLARIKAIVGENFCRRCQYCEPCPHHVPIAYVFRIYKYYKDYGLHEWALEQYKTIKKSVEDCTACGVCRQKCPYNLDIPDKIKEIKGIMGNV